MPTKPKKNQPETPNEVQGKDLFQTPKYAVDLLIPFIPKNITNIWECAAGDGKISDRLKRNGYIVSITDIRYDDNNGNYNFISDNPISLHRNTAIITNPPYSLKRKFYERCREYGVPFALLIPCDYCLWIIDAIRNDGAEKIIPTRRINYITPSGRGSGSQFHSCWFTWGFNLGKSEIFLDLTKEMMYNI